MAQHLIDDEAMAWVLRVAEPGFEDWDAYTEWLDADPARSARYDAAAVALAAVEADVARIAPTRFAVAANDDAPADVPPAELRPSRRTFWRWGGSAIAASVAGLLGLTLWQARPQPYTIETAPGQQRVVALADGSRIEMAGGSRLSLDRGRPRVASVEGGEMIFHVRHDATAPFKVRVGDLDVTDLGTVFDIKRVDAITRVAVAEGAVMLDPDTAAVRLAAGQAAVVNGGVIARQAAGDVGAWRAGRLTFDDATLAEVASDLSRTLGRPVAVDPGLTRQRRTVTLNVAAVRDDPRLLGRLLDVRVQADARRWTLEPLR